MNKRKFRKILLTLAISVSSLSAISLFNNGDLLTNVNAENRLNGQITINANTGNDGKIQNLAGKEFNLYKLFDAENSENMESINYKMNSEYANALKIITGKDTEYAIIDYIQTMNNNQVINDVSKKQAEETRYSDFRYFIEDLRDEIVREKVTPTQKITVPSGVTSSYTFNVPFGYYIVDEISKTEGTHSASSLCLVNTANPNVNINIKSDFPKLIKQIREDDNRDKIGNASDGWNDIGDYEIGQTVPYRYQTKAPNMNGYANYYFAFHDKMDEELTFNESSIVVKLGNYTLIKDTDYTVLTNLTDLTFKIQIVDLKAIINKYYYSSDNSVPESEKVYGQDIEITYSATLNDLAQNNTGRPGFENDVRLEFSNNPDADGTGEHGYTPWDTVVCFTFRLNGLKVNDQMPEIKLKGAKFRLYSNEACTEEVYVKESDVGYTVINRDSVASGFTPKDAVEMVSNSEGIFNIVGLDSQKYYLKETQAPSGYRLLEKPIIIDIKATYDDINRINYLKGDGATDKSLKSLEVTADFDEFYDGSNNIYQNKLTTNLDDGSFNLKVVNKVGSKLPATGSNLTIILIGGGVCIMGIGLYKKRKSKTKE